MGGFETVGTLLADIANLLTDALRLFGLADKRHWGPDEHEQLRALERALDEARKDFQELAPLVHGQTHYENDQKHESLIELRALRNGFRAHYESLRDWSRSGGPINPVWIRDTHTLQRDLHRAQCRAVRRIFTSDRASVRPRCLGAFLVQRAQNQVRDVRPPRNGDTRPTRSYDMDACAKVGGFERFGENDIAFICDFCDGHLLWEDLESMPRTLTAAPLNLPPATEPLSSVASTRAAVMTNSCWQATGMSDCHLREKQILFAPLAVANHMAPCPGDWLARLLCPFCEEASQQPQEEDDDEDVFKPDHEFEDVAALQEHLEWHHAATSTTSSSLSASANPCRIM